MFPILNPPPSSLPVPSLWVVPVHQPQSSSIVHWTWTGNSFHIWYYTCFNAILPNHPTLSLSHRVQKTVLYISVSFAVSYRALFITFICYWLHTEPKMQNDRIIIYINCKIKIISLPLVPDTELLNIPLISLVMTMLGASFALILGLWFHPCLSVPKLLSSVLMRWVLVGSWMGLVMGKAKPGLETWNFQPHLPFSREGERGRNRVNNWPCLCDEADMKS